MLWGRPNLDGVRSVSLGQVAGGHPKEYRLDPAKANLFPNFRSKFVAHISSKNAVQFRKARGGRDGHRIAGVLIAIAIVFSLEWFWRVEWYVAVPLGVVGYLIVRYATYVMKERGAR